MAALRKNTSTNYFNQHVLRQTCVVNETLVRISARWKVQILYSIHQGDNRFSVLKRVFPIISDHMLGVRLRDLEVEGLITRQTILSSAPMHVKYTTTTKGIALLTIMQDLNEWEENFG